MKSSAKWTLWSRLQSEDTHNEMSRLNMMEKKKSLTKRLKSMHVLGETVARVSIPMLDVQYRTVCTDLELTTFG